LSTIADEIIEHIAARAAGATAPELERQLGIARSTASARTAELQKKGLLAVAGHRTAPGDRVRSTVYVIANTGGNTTRATPVKIKNHFVLVLDGSRSMAAYRDGAARFFNCQIETIQAAKDQESTVTLFYFGMEADRQGSVQEKMFNVPSTLVKPIQAHEYPAIGNTPLYDAVVEAAQRAKCDRDAEKSFVVLCITDGHENQSKRTATDLRAFIAGETATDRWTFAFLVPKGEREMFIANSGVDPGNVREWDDIKVADVETVTATAGFLRARRTGARSTKHYFSADLSAIDARLSELRDVTRDVDFWNVDKESDIQTFINLKSKGKFAPGRSFFEVMKKEKRVEEYKKLLLQDRRTQKVYADGPKLSVRALCGFPEKGSIAIQPGNHGNFVLLAQSMSTNRILPRGTRVAFCSSI